MILERHEELWRRDGLEEALAELDVKEEEEEEQTSHHHHHHWRRRRRRSQQL
jgi:hypothetical protein